MVTTMQRLTGEIGEGTLYPHYGMVTKKFVPKWGTDFFFVELEKYSAALERARLFPSDELEKMMVHEDHFAKFEVGDIIGFEASRFRGWPTIGYAHDLVLIRRADVSSQEMEFSLGYVSVPRRVADESIFCLRRKMAG